MEENIEVPTPKISGVEEEILTSEIKKKPKKPWLKITLFSILGLVLVASLFLAGFWFGQNRSLLKSPEPLDSFPLESHEYFPATWETYVNTKYNYLVNYPSGWEVEVAQLNVRNEERIKFLPPGREFPVEILIAVTENPEGISVEKWPESGKSNIGSYTPTAMWEEIRIGGLSAMATQGVCGWECKDVFLPKMEKMYEFRLGVGDPLLRSQSFEDTFDLMLSTFKFFDQEETKHWKTYTNTEYGYVIKYPPNWFLNFAFSTGQQFSDIESNNPFDTKVRIDINSTNKEDFDKRYKAGVGTEWEVEYKVIEKKITNLTIAGTPAVNLIRTPSEGATSPAYIVEILVAKDNNVFEISSWGESKADQQKYDQTFNLMLSTLHFLD